MADINKTKEEIIEEEIAEYDNVYITGRPRKFKSKTEFEGILNEYFSRPRKAWRITSLAVFLGISRATIYEWIDEKREFSDVLKQACSKIEDKYAENCEKRGNAGDIFILKNMKWSDKTEVDMNVKGDLDLGGVLKRTKEENKE